MPSMESHVTVIFNQKLVLTANNYHLVWSSDADDYEYSPRQRNDGTNEGIIRLDLDPFKEHRDFFTFENPEDAKLAPEVVSKVCVYNHEPTEKKISLMLVSLYEDFHIDPKLAANILPPSKFHTFGPDLRAELENYSRRSSILAQFTKFLA